MDITRLMDGAYEIRQEEGQARLYVHNDGQSMKLRHEDQMEKQAFWKARRFEL